MSTAAAPSSSARTPRPFDVQAVRGDFPALQQTVHGRPLVYLDNAATAQKPRVVTNAVLHFYSADCANIHRGVHALSERATHSYEHARATAQALLGAANTHEIVFVRGTTEAINLVAQSYGRSTLRAGDQVLLTEMEHHSNIVPWQLVCEQTGAELLVLPMNDDGDLLLDELDRLLTPRVRLVAVTHVSNALGTVNPVREIARRAHAAGAVVVVDGAQAVPHLDVDVVDLDCDFYAFSGHKLYGPTGTGVLYGKEALLDRMPPYMGGGEMIRTVTFEKTTYNELPHKFEAGTPDIAGGIGLGAAIHYVQSLDRAAVRAHEERLLAHATASLATVPGVRLIGQPRRRAGVVSFVLDGVHPHDLGTVLDREGIAIRTGHHCAQPVMLHYGLPATARASFALYNTEAEVDALVQGVRAARDLFA
jgi:cysteine desulfurase / selenocysteine lyase